MNHREGSVVTDPDILKAYNTDWRDAYKGDSGILLKPKSTQETSDILRYCNSKRIGVVPQAGNTGLVGGSVPVSNEVIVSIRNMNTIDSLSENGVLHCGAGCILQDLQMFAATRRYLVPVDLGAKGSCCIGGNVSTNAGGQYYYRYGSLHANVLGLQVVLPDGRVLDTMKSGINLKDNTGYDLKHLFIGAEGTLGVVTKVALQCPPLPQARNAVFLSCDSYQNVQETLQLAKGMLGEVLAAFEYMDKAVLDLVAKEKYIPVKPNDGSTNYRYCILIETHGSNQEHDMQKMESFLEDTMAQQYVADGVLAQDLTQLHEMWEIRESCNPIVASQGCVYKYDLSLPISQFDDLVCEVRQRIRETHPDALVVNWGHVIDGNIHLNVTTPGAFEKDPILEALLEPFIFEAVMRRRGSISAEHGLGRCKNEYLKVCKDETALENMRSIKQLFDPNGIMNPGKFLPTR
jgi:FAD/FMN-containing dehydrogenase